ncbi:MAG TPA: hypothetical protein VGJ19_21960 [Streptosporangiaceae bacterium]
MRKLVLAVGGVLLITAGIVLAAVMAITPSRTPGVIGPAVQVGPATATSSGTSSGTATPPATRSTPPAAKSRPAATPAGEDRVHSVSPSPAVQVTDDHGGGRRSGRHGD